jgi:predicted ATP-dependent serine protease
MVGSRNEPSGEYNDARPEQALAHRLTEVSEEAEQRINLPIGEFARVLGGGIVPGSIVLVGGDPGIGKSTLMLQAALVMAARQRVLYVSGEESERQIRMRAARTASVDRFPAELYLVTETSLDAILQHVSTVKPDLLISPTRSRRYTCPNWTRQPGLFHRSAKAPTGCGNWQRLGPAVFLIG